MEHFYAPGTVVVEKRSGLLMQIVLVEQLDNHGETEYYIYFTKPSKRLSEVLLRPCDPTDLNDLLETWKHAKMYYIIQPQAQVPYFFGSCDRVLGEDIGVSVLTYTDQHTYINITRATVGNDYVNYECKENSLSSFVNMYRAKHLGACLYKEIYSRNMESSHYKTSVAIQAIMLKHEYNLFNKWIGNSIFRNS
jgi:hypothetical protein